MIPVIIREMYRCDMRVYYGLKDIIIMDEHHIYYDGIIIFYHKASDYQTVIVDGALGTFTDTNEALSFIIARTSKKIHMLLKTWIYSKIDRLCCVYDNGDVVFCL